MALPYSERSTGSSRSSYLLRSAQLDTPGNTGFYGSSPTVILVQAEHDADRTLCPRVDLSPSRGSFSSANQRTPARSYYHRSSHSSIRPAEAAHNASNSVREETAELASRALSDVASVRSSTSLAGHATDPSSTNPSDSNPSSRPDAILEISEPTSPEYAPPSFKASGSSILTELLRGPRPTQEDDSSVVRTIEEFDMPAEPVMVSNAIISQPHERTPLLRFKSALRPTQDSSHATPRDIESLERKPKVSMTKMQRAITWPKELGSRLTHRISNPKFWEMNIAWKQRIRQPAGCVLAIFLGLLLNILDALSYGMILFPLADPVFESLGSVGISMFYVSCVVSQLVYSLGGSKFKGGVGSEMIEVVPFFHKMSFIILEKVGRDNPESVLATTVVSMSFSSIVTGVTFLFLGKCGIGSLIGFFPRHILIGCIGGVGWFLVATGFEVSARLDGGLEYNLVTLRTLARPDMVLHWILSLLLAVVLIVTKRWISFQSMDAWFFVSLILLFYIITAVLQAVLPRFDYELLRTLNWVFDSPPAGEPFYRFYSLYNFSAVNWKAFAATLPSQLALTFFGVLHVPINIPALALTTGEDNLDLNRELVAHGLSNALSGFCGSIQNYLVYTNTVLFINSGGNSRVAGVLLAIATLGVLVVGPVIVGFIPVTVVGALIFFLGLTLLQEALIDTWGKAHRLEYITILIIVVTMGIYDFVYGILIGIVLACLSFVLQTSQVSAIRNILPGGVASSTVRRHPTQHQYLQKVGQQTCVMRLAGYLFFGTIVGVENQIRALLAHDIFQTQPIRHLVLDLSNVDGVDLSAAEAFPRINRILKVKNVKMIMCGVHADREVGRSFHNVGLFEDDGDVKFFDSLNSALEFCENELLKTLYQHRDALQGVGGDLEHLEIPQQDRLPLSMDAMFSSPRKNHLHEVATATLGEQQFARNQTHWQHLKEPVRLILQTFSIESDKPEEFWHPVATFFVREDYAAGARLYSRGDPANGFYLLENGILKAEYILPQGEFTEVIVAGTTCGELPFFSGTSRTATTVAESNCTTWMLNDQRWESLRRQYPEIAQELLKISLKLTSERMDAITKYMLLASG